MTVSLFPQSEIKRISISEIEESFHPHHKHVSQTTESRQKFEHIHSSFKSKDDISHIISNHTYKDKEDGQWSLL